MAENPHLSRSLFKMPAHLIKIPAHLSLLVPQVRELVPKVLAPAKLRGRSFCHSKLDLESRAQNCHSEQHVVILRRSRIYPLGRISFPCIIRILLFEFVSNFGFRISQSVGCDVSHQLWLRQIRFEHSRIRASDLFSI